LPFIAGDVIILAPNIFEEHNNASSVAEDRGGIIVVNNRKNLHKINNITI
jgi:hypothetical protein